MSKLSVSLAAGTLAASLGAFAALPTDAAPFQVVVPNLKSGLDITLEGLYLQPSNSDLDYATISTTTATGINNGFTISNDTDVQTIDPDYNFGFRVGLGYTFEDSGNDVQLSWTHFNHTDSDTTTTPDGSVLTARTGNVAFAGSDVFFPEGFIPVPSFGDLEIDSVFAESSATGQVKTKLDSIDLDVGQYMDVGTRLRLRLFAGLRGAQVRSDMTNTYNSTVSADWEWTSEQVTPFSTQLFPLVPGLISHLIPGVIPDIIHDILDGLIPDDLESAEGTTVLTGTLTETLESKFTGIGPRIGVDANYHLGNCFGFVTHASVGLLVGQVESSTTVTNYLLSQSAGVYTISDGEGGTVTDPFSNEQEFSVYNDVHSDDSTRIVPVLDAKLGLNYSHVFDNESVLNIEGGYQWTQYIDAVDRLDIYTPSIEDEAGSVAVQRTTSSVGFDGPYLSLNWKV